MLSSDLTEKEILFECILSIGKYIDELLKSVGGKTCFELIVFYSFDIEKRATVHPKLNFKKSLAYAQNRIVDYTLKNIEKGIFLPRIPIHSLVMFISSFIDGIAQNVATSEAEENNNSMNIIEMFQILAKAMISFLKEKHI
nr:hypothetical protein JJC16_03090 [Clostridioides sp. ES-S-0107-01]